jgi:hypothetical protein
MKGNMKPGIYRPKLSFEGNFTTIPNHWIRNTGLSVKANFLLVYLLTHEIGYNITYNQIEREIGLGETAIRNAMEELKSFGWLKTERTTDDRGYNAGLAWFLTEPNLVNPDLGNPDLVNPTLEKRGTLENNLIKNKTIKEIYTSEFLEFWTAYPRKVGKKAAYRAFLVAEASEQASRIILGATNFGADPNLPFDQNFIPHPATWLNAGRWDDGPLPERTRTPEEIKAREFAAAQYRREVDLEHTRKVVQESVQAAETAEAPHCEHGRIIAACMPCIRAGKI